MHHRCLRRYVARVLLCGVIAATAWIARSGQKADSADVVRPEAALQTEPMPHTGDAADDPAIWLHPTDPAKSLLLGTDKQGGLHIFDMSGKRRQVVSDGCRPNNVDVLYGFRLGEQSADLAVASVREHKAAGVKVWRIDPNAGELADVTAGEVLPVLDGGTPYGICVYRSPKTGKSYFVVTESSGRLEQHVLEDVGGKVKSRAVRAWKVKSIAEGCVADHELGHLYVAEENVGIWKFPAEPDGGKEGTLIAKVREHGLKADVEGLAIYYASGGKGYLIASSQGSDTFLVYERQGDNRYVLTIDPKEGKIDDVSDTDGIDVTNRPTSRQFPAGFLIVQDGRNAGGNQNFKVYDWRDIAGTRLLVDTNALPAGR